MQLKSGPAREDVIRTAGGPMAWVAMVLISVAFVIWSRYFIAGTSFVTIDGNRAYSLFDDAMISMRYAWNFSHGSGLVWNPGEHIQGYSNLLMTLMMSVATLFLSKTRAVLAIQILGIVFMLCIAWLCSVIAGQLFRDRTSGVRNIARASAFVGGLAYYPLTYWSLMGMETGLLTMLLLFGFASLFWYERSGTPRALYVSAAGFGLAFLTRNDSILFFLLAWGYLVWRSRAEDSKVRIGPVLVAASTVLIVVVSELVFQYVYYGEILPNTFTLKLVGMPLGLRIANGIAFVLPFLGETAVILILAVVSVFSRPRKEKALLLSAILVAVGYQIYIGGDVWPYWRILSPALPLALILDIEVLLSWAGMLVTALFVTPAGASKRPIWGGALTLLLLVIGLGTGLGIANARFFPEIALRAKPYEVDDNRDNVNVAVALDHVLSPNATVGVTWAGALPYYTDFKAIDFLGKTDRYIANLPPDISGSISWNGMSSVPGHNKYDLSYSIIALRPTYVERLAWGRQDVSNWARSYYVEATYRKQTLLLLKNSPDVLWSRLNLDSPGGTAP